MIYTFAKKKALAQSQHQGPKSEILGNVFSVKKDIGRLSPYSYIYEVLNSTYFENRWCWSHPLVFTLKAE